MIFRSREVTAQWDTWCFYFDGTYYLYYLITETSPGEGFGLATSKDGVHWEDHGWCIRASEKMVFYLGTGSVWPDLSGYGKFLCNYSEWRKDRNGEKRQNILFAWSDDLVSWRKLGDDYMFRIDEKYYEPYGRWDCIYVIPRVEGGYWGTWTATPLGRGNLNNGIGIGFSEDGLHWNALPPPSVEPDAHESGAMTTVDARIYAMFGIGGMKAYEAERPDGSYRLSRKNQQLLGRSHSYFSRYFQGPDCLLVNHHVMDGEKIDSGRVITYAAPFKRFSVDGEGIQRWLWWEGNQALKVERADVNGPLNLRRGFVAEADLKIGNSAEPFFTMAVDEVKYGISLHQDGSIHFYAGFPDSPHNHSAQRDLDFSGMVTCRALVRRGMLELYINDYFIECWAMGCAGATDARIGFGKADLMDASVWHMQLPL